MQPPWFRIFALWAIVGGGGSVADDPKIKLADCPEVVQKAFQAEASGAKIEFVTKEKDDEGEVVFWADVTVGGKTYAIGVLVDGTLTEMNLAVGGDEDVAFDRSPEPAQATFKAEAFGEKIKTLAKDFRYGVATFEATVEHKGKSYEIVVAEDGTLVEKVLVIDDEEVEMAACPAAVQAALKTHAKGGTIDGITRSTGVGKKAFEAEIEIKGKVYLIEVDEAGSLISKSLQAAAE